MSTSGLSRPLPAPPPEAPPVPVAGLVGRAGQRLAGVADAWLIVIAGAVLFALAAWPLLLVALPPFQDLPNHVATAHIVAHPELYPQYAFNGLLKSNALLTLWFEVAGRHHPFAAARVFVALVLALNALALPMFVLQFRGRRHLAVALLFAWPLVHSFSVSMGFLNFAFAFALSLILLAMVDQQRQCPSLARGVGMAILSAVVWYAHPFPLALVCGLVALHVTRCATWEEWVGGARALLLPIAPAGLLTLVAAQHHLVKAAHSTALVAPAFHYLNPWQLVAHLWTDVSGALTRWGSMTIVPALLLPWFAWRDWQHDRQRRPGPPARHAQQRSRRWQLSQVTSERPGDQLLLSNAAIVLLAAAYVGLPVMLSNWWCLNCRLVPFLWAALSLRLPRTLPRSLATVLAACALSFSMVTGIDYARLDRDRAEFTAGLQAVPARATLLPLMFSRRKTSDFVASLTHAWAYYTVLKDTSAPLVFAVERSYPITYREFPPRALIPPALDRMAEFHGTPAQVCKDLGQGPGQGPDDEACTAAWRDLWDGFWRQASPRFSHLLTWAMPPDARPMIPDRYHRVFAAGDLEIYARADGPAAE